MPRHKLTEAERWRRRADRENARRRAAAPLFADAMEPVTAEGLFWKWRRDVARAVEHLGRLSGGQVLDALTEARLRREAEKALPPETFAAHCARRGRLPASPEYGLDLWRKALKEAAPEALAAFDRDRRRAADPPFDMAPPVLG